MFKPLLCMLIGLIIAGTEARVLWKNKALDQRAATATLEPIDEYAVSYKKANPTLKSYKVDLRFHTASGELVSTTRTIPAEILNQLIQRTPVSIQYLPDDPQVNRVGKGVTGSPVEMGAGLLLLLAGAGWFWRVLKSSD